MGDPIEQRENLYKLIISQLRYDGLEAVAATLSKIVNTASPCPPSARLHQVVNLGVQAENDGVRPEPKVIPGLTAPVSSSKGIDMEYEPEGKKNHSENGESSNTADEGFLSNLKLQKVSDGPGKEQKQKQDSPSDEEVRKHIYLITSGRKPKPVPEQINIITTDESSADSDSDICGNVKKELQRFNISQEVFAKVVIGKTQGYLSEMLRQGEKAYSSPDKMFSKGQKNFDAMREFLKLPEHERRRRYTAKAEELRLEKLRKREIEQGSSMDSPKKKPRQQIPSDSKDVNERFHYSENSYPTAAKRESVADQPQVPEQSLGDFFKSLLVRSQRKHEERIQRISANSCSDSAEEEEEEEMMEGKHDNSSSRASPRKSLIAVSLNNKPHKTSPLNSELVSQDSSPQEIVTSRIVALSKKPTAHVAAERSSSECSAVSRSSRLSEVNHRTSYQGQDPSAADKLSDASFELQVERDPGFLTRDTKMEVFHPISGEELFVVQLEESAVPSRVHLSPM